MRKTFTTQVRILLCQGCGAPLELAPTGVVTACSYCHAQNQITKGLGQLLAPPSMPIDENERLRRLRMQDGRPFVPPASLMPLIAGGGLHPAKVEEAFYIYQATRREVQTTHNPEAAERLFALTLIVNTHLAQQSDHVRRRPLLESSLDALELPRHRQVLHCLLASASAKEGDFASAEQWIAPCNTRSDDLDADSAFRVARAFIDTARGDFNAVMHALGPIDDGYPIADTWDPTAAVLRANALEKLGNLQAAIEALRSRMSKESAGGRATMQAIVQTHMELQLCPQSFAAATQGHAQQAAQVVSRQSGGGIGSIFYWVGLAVTVFGVLLALGLSVPMIAAGALSGEGMGGIGAGIGAGIFSGFMALVTTVPLGLIFFFIGRSFRNRAQQAAWLRVNGIQAQGRVRGMAPTGVSINHVPMMRIELEIMHPSAPPYVASCERLFDHSMTTSMRPGATVPVRVHPQRPSEILVESA